MLEAVASSTRYTAKECDRTCSAASRIELVTMGNFASMCFDLKMKCLFAAFPDVGALFAEPAMNASDASKMTNFGFLPKSEFTRFVARSVRSTVPAHGAPSSPSLAVSVWSCHFSEIGMFGIGIGCAGDARVLLYKNGHLASFVQYEGVTDKTSWKFPASGPFHVKQETMYKCRAIFS